VHRKNKPQIGSKITECQSWQRLGESIGELIFGGDDANFQFSNDDSFTNEVIINFNVFHAPMKDRIGR
jgi:hypothetical protein